MTEALVSCVVGRVEYALRAGDIVAVMRAERMRAPGPCEAGIGVVTVGGERASVYPLGQTVGLPAAPHETLSDRDRHVVVVRGQQGPVGWLVDRVARSHLPADTPVLPLPALLGTRVARLFAGVLSAGDRTLLLLAATQTKGRTVPTPTAVPARSAAASERQTDAAASPLVVTFTSAVLPDCGVSRYAISARRVCGVESHLDVVPVPGSEAPVIGVAVWHGGVVPVVDVRGGSASRETIRRRLLILRGGGRLAGTLVALPIDAETALWQPTDGDLAVDSSSRRGYALPPYVAGLFDVRGHTVALLDPDLLLPEGGEATPAGDLPRGSDRTAAGRSSSPWTRDHRSTHA